MSGFSISDLVNSIFGQDIYQTISDFQTIFSFVASGELDLLSAVLNDIGSFTGSMVEGLLNFYVNVGYQIFIIPVEYMLPYSLIFGLINLFVQVVGNIFNIGPENVIPLKQIALAFADKIFDILKVKATDEVVKLHIEIIKFLINIESLGLALYDVCKNLLDGVYNLPQKFLFSLLWMVKIFNSFTGSLLSLAQDVFSVLGGLDVSELTQLEAYTILVNMCLETALFLFFQVIFKLNNINNLINTSQFIILTFFTISFLFKSFKSFEIKQMEVKNNPKEIIQLKKMSNIKLSLVLEFSQLLLKIYSVLAW